MMLQSVLPSPCIEFLSLPPVGSSTMVITYLPGLQGEHLLATTYEQLEDIVLENWNNWQFKVICTRREEERISTAIANQLDTARKLRQPPAPSGDTDLLEGIGEEHTSPAASLIAQTSRKLDSMIDKVQQKMICSSLACSIKQIEYQLEEYENLKLVHKEKATVGDKKAAKKFKEAHKKVEELLQAHAELQQRLKHADFHQLAPAVVTDKTQRKGVVAGKMQHKSVSSDSDSQPLLGRQ